ncbi:hypothetical protein [Caldimonas brevitalea]|nr:hypothetical protein [Caldimonas brevitalea]
MSSILFVLLIATLVWVLFCAATWFPPWPSREQVLEIREQLRGLKMRSKFQYCMALMIESIIAYPVHGLVVSIGLAATILKVIAKATRPISAPACTSAPPACIQSDESTAVEGGKP